MQITEAEITYKALEEQTQTYNGDEFNGSGVTDINTRGDCAYTLRYGTTEGVYDLTDRPSAKFVADSKDVYFQITADNHKTVQGSYYLGIEKGDISCESPTQIFDYQEGVPQGNPITATIPTSETVVVKYKFNEGDEYTLDIAQQTDPGNYHVWFEATAENYNNKNGEYDLIINPPIRQDGFISPEPSNNDSFVYDGLVQSLADYANDGQHTFSNSDIQYSIESAEGP